MNMISKMVKAEIETVIFVKLEELMTDGKHLVSVNIY
jgi:hypothetical protein